MDIPHKITSNVIKHKKIIGNFSYLAILQIFNMILPLITYPYLIRVLGAELYGRIIFSQAIMSYFSVVINFGFNISATKDIAQNQNNKQKISEIISSVLTIQFFLWFFCFISMIIMINIIPSLKENQLLYIFSFGITFNELLFPVWYFQGIEKMKFITYINLIIRILFLILIFIFIRNQFDYLLVPLFNALGNFIGGVVSLAIIFLGHKLSFKIYPFKILKKYLTNSFYLFISKIEILIKDKSIIIILGVFFNKTIVSHYDIASKLVNLFITLYQIIPTVILPRLIQQRNYIWTRVIFLFSIVISILYYCGISFFSDQIISILTGNNLTGAKIYIIIVGLLVLTTPINTLLNYYLIISNKEKTVLKSVTVTLVSFLIMVSLGLLCKNNINIFLYSMVLSGIIELFYKIYIFKYNYELWQFITPLKR
jgi:PST family polysaccharide transporter